MALEWMARCQFSIAAKSNLEIQCVVCPLCRDAGMEVMYTVIQSLTANGRDRSLDYKISGFHVPPGSWDAQVRHLLRRAEH